MFPGTHARTTPDKLAVIMAGSGRTLTYRELDENSARLAGALYERGLRPGDVVAMLSDNAPECFEIYWSALRSGLYITAINHHLTAEEAAYIVADSGARVLIASAPLGQLAEDVLARVSGVAGFSFRGALTGFDPYEDLLASGLRLTDQPRGAGMLYSSGTTGRPKGVKAPMLGIDVDQAGEPLTMLAGQALGFGPDDIYLSPAPIYHAAPLRWSGVVHAYGATVVVMERFDAAGALHAIETHKVTVVQMVPTMFVRMLQLGDERLAADLSTLRLVIHAAAPCPPDVEQAMIDWVGPILVEYYSSTEGNGLTVITTPEWLRKRGSVGRSMLGPVHVCAEDGSELAAGEVGLVYFERDIRPFAYHNDAAKTADATHPQHPMWTTVGDLGYVDTEGFLFLTDRKSFMIISGGVNIYPQEIENALTLHPQVLDVAVIGVPDPEMGQQVKAVIQLRPGVARDDQTRAALLAHLDGALARYKHPRSIDFVDTLPRTPTGKLVKRELVERYTKAGSR